MAHDKMGRVGIVEKEYGKSGYLKTITTNNTVRCRIGNVETSIYKCAGIGIEGTPCKYFNGFRENQKRTRALFCVHETEEEAKQSKVIMDIIQNRSNICPTCGTVLIRNIIPDGMHKGHGSISCPKCEKPIIVI